MNLRLSRLLIGMVLLFNVQCAVVFLWQPQAYAPSFGLQGVSGAIAIRALGILFLMWNVPYVLATWNPRKYNISLYEAIAMQTIGVVGESLLLGFLPAGYESIRPSIWRFIFFDGFGLAALCMAFWLSRTPPPQPLETTPQEG